MKKRVRPLGLSFLFFFALNTPSIIENLKGGVLMDWIFRECFNVVDVLFLMGAACYLTAFIIDNPLRHTDEEDNED